MPVVLVTHDLDEAALLSDRMAVLADGHALQSGTPAQVLQQPASVRVAQFVGMRNLFTAEVEGHDPQAERTWLRWEGLALAVPLASAHAPGSKVAWAIPSEQVLLPAQDGLPDLDGDTGVEVEVLSVAALRQSLQVTLQAPCMHELVMQVSPGDAARHGIEPGRRVRVRLRGRSMVVLQDDMKGNG